MGVIMTDRMGNTRSVASGLSCGKCALDIIPVLEEGVSGDGFVVSVSDNEMAIDGAELAGSPSS